VAARRVEAQEDEAATNYFINKNIIRHIEEGLVQLRKIMATAEE
jgi:hypothetical protein